MTTWAVIAAIGFVTYVIRASMFVVVGGRALPSWIDRPMAVVAPAAVASLLGSMVLTVDGRIDPIETPQLVAVAAGFVAVRRSGNVLHAFTVGMPVMWALSAAGV